MSDTNVSAGALAAVAAVIVSAAIVTYDSVKDTSAKTEAQVKAGGTATAYNVYPVRDAKGGPTIYVAKLSDGGFQKLDTSPCARRPTGVKPTDCMRRLPDAGLVDFGDENTMQPDEWVGAGCVPTACVVVAGEDPEGIASPPVESIVP